MSPPHSCLQQNFAWKSLSFSIFLLTLGRTGGKVLSSFQSAQLLFVFPLCLSFLFPGDVSRILCKKKEISRVSANRTGFVDFKSLNASSSLICAYSWPKVHGPKDDRVHFTVQLLPRVAKDTHTDISYIYRRSLFFE